jgi:hypothetical protein
MRLNRMLDRRNMFRGVIRRTEESTGALSSETGGGRTFRRILRDRDAIMQPGCRHHDREIGSLRLGKFFHIRDDAPHMPFVVRRVTRALLLGEKRREPDFPLRCLVDHCLM